MSRLFASAVHVEPVRIGGQLKWRVVTRSTLGALWHDFFASGPRVALHNFAILMNWRKP